MPAARPVTKLTAPPAPIASLILAVATASALASPIFVDADAGGAGDGTSWADAYTDLSDALWSAGPGDEVWVAEGVYRPTRPAELSDPWTPSADPRAAFFWIKRRVSVYGGFAGTESSLSERAGLFSSTVLEGDLGVPGEIDDNAYRLVLYWTEHADEPGGTTSIDQSSRARFNGFTVRNANGGGGMLVYPTVASQAANLDIEHVTFANNRAVNGGGINYQAASSRPIRWCTFIGNHAEGSGGGVYSDPVYNVVPVVGCVFEGNTAGVNGGGLFHKQGVLFDTASLYNTVFRNNTAGERGGALYFNAQGATIPLKIANCLFAENTAGLYGGGMWVFGGALVGDGPAVILGSRVVVNTSTFYGNAAGDSGGVASLPATDRTSAYFSATNAIFWDNHAPVEPTAASTAIISSSIVGGGWNGGGGHLVTSDDPLFLDPPADLRLASLSPAIDRGDTFNLASDYFDLDGDTLDTEQVPVDLDGLPRRVDAWAEDAPIVPSPVVDLGAFESRAACRADINGDGSPDLTDLDAFLGFFHAEDARADMNRDGLHDLTDLVVFAASFTGCAG